MQWDATAPQRARQFVADVLERSGADDRLREQAILLVSEVVSNVVRHAFSEATIVVDVSDEHLRVSVTDDGPGWPNERRPDARGGFGLYLVDKVATNWGTYRIGDGKTVWFELAGN